MLGGRKNKDGDELKKRTEEENSFAAKTVSRFALSQLSLLLSLPPKKKKCS